MNVIIQLYRYSLESATSEEDKKNKIQRNAELEQCFYINSHQDFIKRMFVFLDNPSDEEYFKGLVSDVADKVTFVPWHRQPHYKDFFEYTKKNIPNNEVVCFLATDIYFNWGLDLSFFDKFLPAEKAVFGITRHEPTNKEHTICNETTCALAHSPGGCGDCFIFRTPVPENLDIEALDHKQNRWGGECNFLHQWNRIGAKIYNPCYQVKTIHLHLGSVYFTQNPNKIVYGRPYLPDLEPCPTDSNHCINRPVALYSPGSVLCFRCKAYPNNFCKWQNGGKEWTCSICNMHNTNG